MKRRIIHTYRGDCKQQTEFTCRFTTAILIIQNVAWDRLNTHQLTHMQIPEYTHDINRETVPSEVSSRASEEARAISTIKAKLPNKSVQHA